VSIAPTRTPETDNDRPSPFVTTRWSVVLAAKDKTAPESAAALEALCQTYWYPLYAFLRKSGHSPPDAQDLTQEFFARFLARDWLRPVLREKGRFRTFLLITLKRFVAKEWQRATAQKRGGGNPAVSLDALAAEDRFTTEPALAPDELYERRWAMTLLNNTLTELGAEFQRGGRGKEFDILKGWLTAGRGEIPYAEVATALGTTSEAARVAVHRLRKQFRERFSANIAQTVETPEEVKNEIRHLVSVLSRG